jgi:hypothetical protein
VPEAKQWDAMAALHKAAGTRYIIGLPLFGNRPQLVARIMAAAHKKLGAALVGFELSNEPQYW